jgi:hypothetical protein
LASHLPNGPAPLNHLMRCAGTGTAVAGLTPWVPPKPPGPKPLPALSPQPWTPPPILPDPAPYRRWRSYGWTEHQIRCITGEGALW